MKSLDPENFVRALEKSVRDPAVSNAVSVMTRPPGRKPPERLVALATWYSGLDEQDRLMLRAALKLVADSALFGFLCVLDGARAIESGDNKGEFRLLYLNGADTERCLSGPGKPLLHEFFQKAE